MRYAILILAALPVFALDNSDKLTNNYTGVITNHPVWFGKWIKEGEITNYPRPYATPSDTGTRAAVTTWQADVKSRWRDSSSARTITGASVGATGKTWTGSSGITSVLVGSSAGFAAGFGKITFGSAHNLAAGDRLVMSLGGANQPNKPPQPDNVTVYCVTAGCGGSTTVALIRWRGNVGGSLTNNASFTGANVIQVSQQLDPMSPANSCRYLSANHGFFKGETVVIAAVGGITASSATQIITGVTRNEFSTNATCSGTYTSGGTATGPDNGSVRFALVSMITSIPASGSTRIDFVNSTDPSSAGDAAATAAAGFDKTEALAATWNADLVASADVKSGATAAITTSARTLLTKWNETQTECGPRYWAQGPVITWLILEYGCDATTGATISADAAYQGTLPTDFGWKIRPGTNTTQAITTAGQTQFAVTAGAEANISVGTTLWVVKSGSVTVTSVIEQMTVTAEDHTVATCNGAAITVGQPCLTVTRGANSTTAQTFLSGQSVGVLQWEDATAAYKSLHPVFHLKFLGGSWAGVGTLVEVKNEYLTKQQNLWYSIDFKTGGTPASRIAKSTFKHTGMEAWKLSTWDGTDPEFYNTGGGDPDSGAGTRKRKFIIDHNTPYLIYAKLLPEYKLFANGTMSGMEGGFGSSDKGAIVPGGALGAGTWGRDQDDSNSTALKNFAPQQESYINTGWLAKCFVSWSEACYEELNGDTVVGGGGNTEVHKHIPWNWIEDDATTPRYIMPGFGRADEGAFGKPVSLYSRPTWNGSTAAAATTTGGSSFNHDVFKTACSSAAPATPPQSSDGAVGAANTGWPCFYYNDGQDGWQVDDTHANDWSEPAYWMTGDPRHLESIQSIASWIQGWEAGTHRQGRSWAQPETSTGTEPRLHGPWARSILNAAIHTPNVPQFGASVPPVWSYYWNEKLWDLAFATEGWFNITDGQFAQMYPRTDIPNFYSAPCPITSGVGGSTHSIWHWTRCADGSAPYGTGAIVGGNQPNPLGLITRFVNNTTSNCNAGSDFTWLNCPNYTGTGMWYSHHRSLIWEKAERLNLPMFYYTRRTWINTALSLWGSANWNRFMNDLDVHPTRGPSSGSNLPLTTLSDMFTNGLKATGWAGGYGRNDLTWNHDLTNASPTAKGYIVQWRADLASMSDLMGTPGSRDGCSATVTTPKGCTWRHAWDWAGRNFPKQNFWAGQNKYYMEPRSTVNDLVCTPGGTTAICTYTAPTPDACTYLNGTAAATDTLDATDTSDGGGGGLIRRVVITGLSNSTLYYFRLTCGQRVSAGAVGISATGTGRTTTTFTTSTVGSATTITVKAKAPSGATTATVDYGSTSSVAGGTLGPTACTSGCSFDVPGNSKATVYYRLTYKNGGGTTIAQGSARAVVMP